MVKVCKGKSIIRKMGAYLALVRIQKEIFSSGGICRLRKLGFGRSRMYQTAFEKLELVTPIITNFQSLCLNGKNLNERRPRSINELPFQCTSAISPGLLNHLLPVVLLRRNRHNYRKWNCSAGRLITPARRGFYAPATFLTHITHDPIYRDIARARVRICKHMCYARAH